MCALYPSGQNRSDIPKLELQMTVNGRVCWEVYLGQVFFTTEPSLQPPSVDFKFLFAAGDEYRQQEAVYMVP